MKKSLEKMRVRIDQNLNRSEKSVALPPELERIEETVLVYKQVCTTVHKRLSDYLQGAGKGTDGQSIERRLKKTPDFSLGQSLSEQGRHLTKQASQSCLGQALMESGGVCSAVGQSLVQYEISVEQLVVQQLETVLKTDLPSIAKQRKHLDQLILELDTAKARLHTAKQEEASKAVIEPGKVERLVEDLDDIDRRVEQARDLLATDMMNFLTRDAELAGLVGRFLDYKLEYHSSIADQVRLVQPKMDAISLSKRGYPIFGCSLTEHLSSFSLPSGIAFPLQVCVSRLVSLGLEEEGLFRLAAGTSRVKRLRAELETPGLASLPSVETADHHMLTGTIKSYLRELPEPLLGAELYTDWLEAGAIDSDTDRAEAVWNLLQHDKLPREHYHNIQYLFRFLNEVARHEERNKMSPSNLAIVITPNVIWENEAVHDPLDISVGSCLARVVETIITQYHWLFQNDAVVAWDHQLPAGPLGPCTPPSNSDMLALARPAAPRLASSPMPTTRERKGKGKKAPPPPELGHASPTQSHASPSSQSHASPPGHAPSPSNSPSPHSRQQQPAANHNADHSPAPPALFPVPAPRSVKPAVPSKPEGISRHASITGRDRADSAGHNQKLQSQSQSQPGWSEQVLRGESTNL